MRGGTRCSRAIFPGFPGLGGVSARRRRASPPGVSAGQQGEVGRGMRRGELPSIPGASPTTSPFFFVTVSVQSATSWSGPCCGEATSVIWVWLVGMRLILVVLAQCVGLVVVALCPICPHLLLGCVACAAWDRKIAALRAENVALRSVAHWPSCSG
jgi:hypothetical protein